MSRRNGCGNSIDDCNKSQPVCPGCGEPTAGFSADTDPSDRSFATYVPARTEQILAESVHIAALRGVCLHCGGAAEGWTFSCLSQLWQ